MSYQRIVCVNYIRAQFSEEMVAICEMMSINPDQGFRDTEIINLLVQQPYNMYRFMALLLVAKAIKAKLLKRKGGTSEFVLSPNVLSDVEVV